MPTYLNPNSANYMEKHERIERMRIHWLCTRMAVWTAFDTEVVIIAIQTTWKIKSHLQGNNF